MKFFVPFADSNEQALDVIRSVAEFIGNPIPEPTELIHTVHYTHNGEDMIATVGESIDPYYKEPAATIIAIFPPHYEGAPIKICLRDRGVARGEPIYISGDSEFITFTSE